MRSRAVPRFFSKLKFSSCFWKLSRPPKTEDPEEKHPNTMTIQHNLIKLVFIYPFHGYIEQYIASIVLKHLGTVSDFRRLYCAVSNRKDLIGDQNLATRDHCGRDTNSRSKCARTSLDWMTGITIPPKQWKHVEYEFWNGWISKKCRSIFKRFIFSFG